MSRVSFLIAAPAEPLVALSFDLSLAFGVGRSFAVGIVGLGLRFTLAFVEARVGRTFPGCVAIAATIETFTPNGVYLELALVLLIGAVLVIDSANAHGHRRAHVVGAVVGDRNNAVLDRLVLQFLASPANLIGDVLEVPREHFYQDRRFEEFGHLLAVLGGEFGAFGLPLLHRFL